MPTTGLTLDALDALLFRDGRPFGSGGGGRADTRQPLPQTLTGALRTHALRFAGARLEQLGRHVRDMPIRDALAKVGAPPWALDLAVRGPLPALLDPEGGVEPLYPAPANLYWAGEPKRSQIVRADPLAAPPPGWPALARDGAKAQHTRSALWCRGSEVGKPVRGFLRRAGAERWLAGGVPDASNVFDSEALFVYERRTGLAIHEETQAAEEGLLYAVRLLRPRARVANAPALARHRVVFYAELTWPDDGPDPEALFGDGVALPWGGEGRRAAVRTCQTAGPKAVEPSDANGRLAAWLVTPAIFERGWRPDQDAGLVAAAVSGSLAVSGWDLARRAPKPNRFAVPAGSVYFFDAQAGRPPNDLLADDEYRRQGWAMTLRGGWNHA